MVNYGKEAVRKVQDKIRLQSYYRDVFGDTNFVQGQKVLEHICKVGFVNRSSYVHGNPYQSAFNEGMRQLALSILSHANKNPMEYTRQLEQQINGIDSSE